MESSADPPNAPPWAIKLLQVKNTANKSRLKRIAFCFSAFGCRLTKSLESMRIPWHSKFAFLALYVILQIGVGVAHAQIGGFDPSFVTGPILNAGANATVRAMAIQPDGGVIVAGDFTSIGGVSRNRIARLTNTGALDSSFLPQSGANGPIYAVVLQEDGRILIGGAFTTYDGTSRNRIARLNNDGTLDQSFDPGVGPNGNVYAIALNNNSSYYYGYDSPILIGGTFTSVGGTSRNYIAQLISNGALDTSNYPGGGANAPVLAIATRNNNYYSSGIYIGGLFTNIGGQTRNRLAKINSNGSVDYYFNSGTGLDGPVYALALDDDMYSSSTRLYVGGNFTTVGGTYRGKIARFLVSSYGGSDSLDQNYYAWLDAPVRAIIPEKPSTWNQSRILVAGDFTTVFTNSGGVVAKNRLARFSFNENYYDPYGSSPTVNLDTEFSPSPGINDSVYALAKIPDGRTLVGGKFNQVSGISTSGLAQIYSDFGNNLPGTPSSLKASPANATQMILDWGSASNSSSQDIERSLDGLNGWVHVGSSGSIYIDTGLAAGTTYFYRIKASNYNGSTYSAVASATTETSIWTGPGILDPSASPNGGTNSTVNALARQTDGKTIIVGSLEGNFFPLEFKK